MVGERTSPLLDVADADGHPPADDVLAQLGHALAAQLGVDAVLHPGLLVDRHVRPVPLRVLGGQTSSLLFGKGLQVYMGGQCRIRDQRSEHARLELNGDRGRMERALSRAPWAAGGATYVELGPFLPIETAFGPGFFCRCGGQEPRHGYYIGGARRKGCSVQVRY